MRGVRGEIRVESYTGEHKGIGTYDTVHIGDTDIQGESCEYNLVVKGEVGDKLICVIAGLNTKDSVLSLVGKDIWVHRHKLRPLGEEEYYHHDLLNMVVKDHGTGEVLGKVHAVYNYGAGDLIEISFDNSQSSKGLEVVYRFSKENFPTLDLDKRYLSLHIEKGGD